MSSILPARASALPRDLHPVAWWAWALGLAAAASSTTNPVLLLGIVAAASLVVAARRGDHPWSRAFRLYLLLGVVIVVIRVAFRILLGGGAYAGSTVWFSLPEVPLPDWVAGITLLGDVTAESVLGAAYDGLRLATLVICVGAANALANPKRLLRSLPAALYEVGTALVVAISVLPQLASSLARVRRAQQLRGAPRGRGIGLRRTVVPVLEDALDRSLLLAASMDSRGYGRSDAVHGRGPRRSTWWLVAALMLLGVATYAFLDRTAPSWLAWSTLLAGAATGGLGVVESGRAVRRTRYRPDPWRLAETAVTGCGLLVLVAVAVSLQTAELVVRPDVTAAPTLTVTLLAAVLLAAAPAALAPAPASAQRPHRAARPPAAPRATASADTPVEVLR
ncbi:energy-coupling factor transporter transmembrane protein EcfT [Nocardioidaceae bacterium]|nr:energy-coupling factor transporter transmembrane protein EcfT [Nocardioidaceae bacterium]